MCELMYPSQIRFIHDTIANVFRNGEYLEDVIEDLCSGHIDVEDFPTMEVVEIDGNFYTFGNRRLYVFRVAQCRGAIERIPIKIVPSKRLKRRKYTTTNGGRTIEVRGGVTDFHCKLRWLKNKSPNAGGTYENRSLEGIVEAFGSMGLSRSEDYNNDSDEYDDEHYDYEYDHYEYDYVHYEYDYVHYEYDYDLRRPEVPVHVWNVPQPIRLCTY